MKGRGRRLISSFRLHPSSFRGVAGGYFKRWFSGPQKKREIAEGGRLDGSKNRD
jgi:hypothetical protein